MTDAYGAAYQSITEMPALGGAPATGDLTFVWDASANRMKSMPATLGASNIVSVTAATYTVTAADVGNIINLNRAAGITVTLPAATGTGNVYSFHVGTSVTSNSHIIKVANASDIMGGVATIGSSGGTSLSTGTATTSDTITLNGSTQGGLLGTWVEVRDVQTNLFQVTVHGVGSGVAITPFSATV